MRAFTGLSVGMSKINKLNPHKSTTKYDTLRTGLEERRRMSETKRNKKKLPMPHSLKLNRLCNSYISMETKFSTFKRPT